MKKNKKIFILSGLFANKKLLHEVGTKSLRRTVDVMDYYFVGKDEFLKPIKEAEFLGYANGHGDYPNGS
jgi:guanylate kinase